MSFCTSIELIEMLREFTHMADGLFRATKMNRRQMLRRTGAGFGSLALAALLADETRTATPAANPLASREPHFKARAKRVIFLFMPGGPSQVDTFDPKPRLTRDNAKPSPKLYLGQKRNLLASPWKFQKYGKSGLEVSELFPMSRRALINCASSVPW